MQLIVVAIALALASPAFGQNLLESAVEPQDVDLQATVAIHGDKAAAAVREQIEELLDMTHGTAADATAWSAGSANGPGDRFLYRVAFKHPAQIGTVLAVFGTDHQDQGAATLSYLKPAAVYPGDPANAGDWEQLQTFSIHGRLECTLPSGLRTRAILCSETRTRGTSALRKLHLLKARVYNATPHATAIAETAPYGTDAAEITRGRPWSNAGADENKRIFRYPVSSVHPSWFVLAWRQPQRLAAFRLRSTIGEFRLYAYTGKNGLNPAVAPQESWERFQYTVLSRERDASGRNVLDLSLEPVRTTAIKLLILETEPKGGPIVTIDELTSWADLGDGPLPAPPKQAETPPPLEISYRLDCDAEVALVIDDVHGRRVRNLVAEAERKKGVNVEHWDLKDEEGFPVPPGKYKWKAIYAPPLELHYEFTLYPNVERHSPESRPWCGGPRDSWLANHANNSAACVVGDKLFLAAGGTEGGHALIETTLTGAKTWGTPRGADRLCSDGKTLFVLSNYSTDLARLDPVSHEWQDLLSLGANPERKGKLAGMAAKDGKVFLAFNGPIPWLDNATSRANVEIGFCLPKLRERVENKERPAVPGFPRSSFISLFRLGGDIPDGQRPGELAFIESTMGMGRRQHVLLAFKQPVPLGSVVLPPPEERDLELSLSVLKPNAPWPPNVKNEQDWITVESGKLLHWNCLPMPENTVTRALRVTFAKPGDELTKDLEAREPDVDDAPSAEARDGDITAYDNNSESAPLEGKRQLWSGRIEGMRLLRCRFKSLLPEAKVRVNSGVVDARTGEWDARRTEILSAAKPGIYALEWDKPQRVRGLSIKEIDGALAEIDVHTGPAGAPIDIEGKEHWTQVGSYTQALRTYFWPGSNNGGARYLDGTVDFGKDYETRAVRLRVVRQWTDSSIYGVRSDRGATNRDPARCRVYGVTPLQYLGGEPPMDPLIAKRLTTCDGESGKVLDEKPLEITGEIAFNPDGVLYAVQDRKIARVNLDVLTLTDFITDLKEPGAFAFGPDGKLYAYDAAPERRVVRVYDRDGRYLHSIGTPGPLQAGSYDPARLPAVCSVTVDRANNIWIVSPNDNPRRVAQFKTGGTYVQELLGNTYYGGGGTMDPYDKSRLYYLGMAFEADWDKGTSRIKNLLSLDWWRPEVVPIIVDGRRYLVSAPLIVNAQQPVGVVYLHDEKTLTMRMVAAVGNAEGFPPFHSPEVLEHLGGKTPEAFRFIWTDRNGDGMMQLGEVQFTPGRTPGLSRFNRDLSATAGNIRYEVKEFLRDGTPVYAERRLPFDALYRLDNGNYLRSTQRGRTSLNEVVSPNGESIWTYPAFWGVSSLYIPPWSPGFVCNQLVIAGHETAHAGDLGEFLVINSNAGQTFIWTADGLLAGRITNHLGHPQAHGWPTEHKRYTRLDGLTLGQEHFHGFFCRTLQDNKYYFIAGHNHISVVEVKGIEKFKRLGGEIEITPAIVEKTRQWDAARLRRVLFEQPPIIECPIVPSRPTFEDMTADAGPLQQKTAVGELATFSMACDDERLYLCWQVKSGPLKNGGDDYRRYFKTGAAVDVLLGTNPKADPQRTIPADGDIRLLITVANDQPVAVFYRPVAPNAPKEHAWKTTTQAGGTASFDEVIALPRVPIKVASAGNGYAVMATVPLRTIGLKVEPGMVLKMDWGVMITEEGNLTTARAYWANKTAVGTTDEPTEARLQPDLWGYVRFTRPEGSTLQPDDAQADRPDLEDLLGGTASD